MINGGTWVCCDTRRRSRAAPDLPAEDEHGDPWDPEQVRFQGMRQRGACIRVLDGWEEIVSVDGNIFYFNLEDSIGQWKKPLTFLVRLSVDVVLTA